MSRLLFAAARGARIQLHVLKGWQQSDFIPATCNRNYEARIHPDDEHLQYGPISTAFRKTAMSGVVEPAGLPYLRGVIEWNEYDIALIEENKNEIDLCVFFLILAEYVADEGL